MYLSSLKILIHTGIQDLRTLVVKELYTLETSYVDSLHFLMKGYYYPLKHPNDKSQSIISSVLVDDIFFQIPQILEHHESFLASLVVKIENWKAESTIGDWFTQSFSSKGVFDTYTAFIRNVRRADDAIKIARQSKPAFEKYLQDMRQGGERLGLTDLLAKPFQRIPRYRLLIKVSMAHSVNG